MRTRSETNRIIIHCSATPADWALDTPAWAKVDEIRRWHKGRGWSDIGYHLIIDRDGTVVEGRDLWRVGAHTRGANGDSIGICLLGGHSSSADDAFDEHFTCAQERALITTIHSLMVQYGKLSVHGHNEFARKACPGFQVAPWAERHFFS